MSPRTPAEVCDFFDFLHRWRYGHVEDPRVLLGWIGCAYLAGALKWRPHIWISGDSSMGKSTLESLVRALLGRAALSVADSTKAYIAQRLKSAARPVLLDEFERDVDPSRQKAIVELATLASREGQAGLGRGSPDGSTRDYMIRACFYFSSIVRAPLRAQERSRIHVVDLQPLGSASVADIRAVNAGVEKFGQGFPARLRARAHAGFWRFQANERVFAEAIQEVWLRGGRIADQMGTLLSMSHMMLSDRPVTLDQAKGLLGNFEGVKDDLVGRPDESEAQHCIAHLLSTTLTLEIEPRRQTKTISEIVNDVRRLQAVDGAIFQGSLHAELKRRGIAIVASESNGEQTLVVGNNHRSLHALYDGTRWNGGAWAHILRRLPGASATKNAVRFAGFQERGTLIPLSALPLVTIDDYSRDGEGVTPAVTPQTPENAGQTEAVTV